MSFDIQYPNITSANEAGKIEQIRSYLFQLADQLKFALNTIEKSGTSSLQPTNNSIPKAVSEKEAQATFDSVKALIIKSAEIVDAYSEEISERFSGEYVAQSDFGTYTENTEQVITKNSTDVTQLFESTKKIDSDVEGIKSDMRTTRGFIRTGKIDEKDGYDIIGIEIGQTNENADGKEVFNKYARFTSDRLSFYDKNDTEVAFISDYKLYITNAQITGTLTLGRYDLDTSNGLAFKWV